MGIEAEEVKEDEGQEESIIEVKISRDYHELTKMRCSEIKRNLNI